MKLIRALVTVMLGTTLTAVADKSPAVDSEVVETIKLFKTTDPKMSELFNTAHGYAVFPKIVKGAAGIGAAEGTGHVFERGQLIGTARMTQVTIGPQLGGQEYAQVIFFENKSVLDDFRNDKVAMSANVSAVAAAEGRAKTARYEHGVMVFTIVRTGLMFEASVGGQSFKFKPLPATAR